MFTNSLIALQDLVTGLAAADLAELLTDPTGHRGLVRVHGGFHVVASSVNPARMNAERHLAENDLRSVSRRTGITDSLAIGARLAAEGLTNAVAQTRADLLVIAAEQVLAASEPLSAALVNFKVPVAVTSLGGPRGTGTIETIGVAVDGSPAGERALIAARRLAGESGVKLSGLQVAAPTGLGGKSAAARAAEDLIAFSHEVDLLILGPRPQRPLRRLLGPSTVESLLSASAAPVLLVPTGAEIASGTPARARATGWTDMGSRPVLRCPRRSPSHR